VSSDRLTDFRRVRGSSRNYHLKTSAGALNVSHFALPLTDLAQRPIAGCRVDSISPEVLEPRGRQFGVADRVLDVLVAEVSLQGPGIVALVRQGEPARMTEHVGMCLEPEPSLHPCPIQHSSEAGRRERTTTFAGEDEGALGLLLTLKTAESPSLEW
jgi:hypothetical protein